MTEEEKELTNRYGITVEQQSVHHHKGHKYERLKDALNYAKIDAGTPHKSGVPPA